MAITLEVYELAPKERAAELEDVDFYFAEAALAWR